MIRQSISAYEAALAPTIPPPPVCGHGHYERRHDGDLVTCRCSGCGQRWTEWRLNVELGSQRRAP